MNPWSRRSCAFMIALCVFGAARAVAAAPPGQTSQPDTRSVRAVRVVPDAVTIWTGPVIPVSMTQVKAGTLLEVVSQQGQWYEVRLPFDPTRNGYVLAHLVEPVELPAASTSSLPDRASPSPPVAAPTPQPVTESLFIPRAATRPKAADVWALNIPEAAVVANFRQNRPGDGSPVSHSTAVSVWYDDDNLYVVFNCADDPNQVRARLSKRETIGDDDLVAVYLDTFQDRRRAYVFEANPLGIQRDGILTEGQGTDYSFDTVWRSDGTLTEHGFIVFITVPFKSLRFSNAVDQRWGIAFGRHIPRASEEAYWPFITTRINGFVNQLAQLSGLNHISPGHNAHLVPYAAFTGARYLDTTAPAFVKSADGRAGFDAKTVLRDAVTVDATVNPDFSQVESDDPQVTVNRRFEVFFPEKRPFFIENGGFFETPERLLFTRRIVDPSVGVRVTGKGHGWTIGALAVDDRAPGTTAPPDSPFLDQRAWTAAVRLQREVGQESAIGVLATGRDFATSGNGVIAADARLKFGKNWVFTGEVARSLDRALDEDDVRRGTAMNASWSRSGRNFTYTGSYLDRSPDFAAALGFIKRVDIRQIDQYASYYWRPKAGTLLAVGPSFYGSGVWDHAGMRQDWDAQPRFDVYFRRQLGFSVYRVESYEAFDGIDLRQNTTGVSAYAKSKRLSVSGAFSVGTSPNYSPQTGVAPFLGDARTASVAATFRPNQRLRLDQSYYYTSLATRAASAIAFSIDPRGRATNVFSNHISRTKLNMQFTRELSVRAIVDYNTLVPTPSLIQYQVSKRITGDLLVTYLVNPFTALYAGYAERYQNLDLESGDVPRLRLTQSPSTLSSRQLFLKLSYRIGL